MTDGATLRLPFPAEAGTPSAAAAAEVVGPAPAADHSGPLSPVTISEGQQAAGAEPARDPRGYCPAGTYRQAFADAGAKPGTVWLRARRWYERLPHEQKPQAGQAPAFHVRGDARLPSGQTVAEFAQGVIGRPIPRRIKRGSPRQQQRHLARMRVAVVAEQLRAERDWSARAFQEELKKRFGGLAADFKLGLGPKALKRLFERLAKGQLTDGRYRSGRKAAPGVEAADPRLRECYVGRAMHRNFQQRRQGKITPLFARAFADTRDLAENLNLPMPAADVWRNWFRKNFPQPAIDYAASPRRFEAADQPKIAREYTDIDPLEWISIDGHVLDIQFQASDAAKSGKTLRPALVGVLDIRTRMFVGWDLRPTENADGVLAALMMMHRDFGCAKHYYADNGEAEKRSLGHKHTKALYDDPRLGQLVALTKAQRHNALPYCGWSKLIEHHWRTVAQGFARYFASWWGNRPEARPDGAAKIPVWQRPALRDGRTAFIEFLRGYHAEPQHGDGMYGLSPQTAMQQFCTRLDRVDDDVLGFICAKSEGTRIVGRDGVRVGGRIYGQCDEEVWKWQRREVGVRSDPADASYVWLYDPRSHDVLIASNRRLSGATAEDVAEAARTRARRRKAVKEYLPARDFLLESTPQQIMQARAERAQARDAARQAELPAAQAPAVTIVCGDLVEPVRRAKRRQALQTRAEGLNPAGFRGGLEAASSVYRGGFERLAEKARAEEVLEGAEPAAGSAGAQWAAFNQRQEAAG